MSRPSRLVAVTLVLGLASADAPAIAATTRTFVVDATIVNGCAVTQIAGAWGKIDFGTVSSLATGTLDASLLSGGVAGLSIECTPGTSVSLNADNGNNALSGQRRLLQAGVTTAVPYALYANGSVTPWTTQAIALSFPVGSTKQTLPIKGRVTLPGALRAGKYIDTVRITVAW